MTSQSVFIIWYYMIARIWFWTKNAIHKILSDSELNVLSQCSAYVCKSFLAILMYSDSGRHWYFGRGEHFAIGLSLNCDLDLSLSFNFVALFNLQSENVHSPGSGRLYDAPLYCFPDIVFKIRQPVLEEVPSFRDQGTLYSFIYPAQNKEVIAKLADKKMTVFGENQWRLMGIPLHLSVLMVDCLMWKPFTVKCVILCMYFTVISENSCINAST